MALMPSEELLGFLNFLGLQWPTANEDEMREVAELEETLAREYHDLQQQLSQLYALAKDDFQGDAGSAFQQLVVGLSDGGAPALEAAASQARQIAAIAEETATQVEYMKLSAIMELVSMFAEFLLSVALSYFLGPLMAAAMELKFLITRTIILRLILFVVNSILAQTALGAGIEAALDLLVQKIQIDRGHRKDFDYSLTSQAAVSGAIGGALGGLLDPLGTFIGKGLGKLLTGDVSRALGTELRSLFTTAGKPGTLAHTVTPFGLADDFAGSFADDMGRLLAGTREQLGKDLGKGFTPTTEHAFREQAAKVFDKHLGSTVPDAPRLGDDWAGAVAKSWNAEPAVAKETITKALKPHTAPSGLPDGTGLGHEAAELLTDKVPALLRTSAHGGGAALVHTATDFAGGVVMDGVTNVLTEGTVALVYEGEFTVSGGSFVAGLGMGALARATFTGVGAVAPHAMAAFKEHVVVPVSTRLGLADAASPLAGTVKPPLTVGTDLVNGLDEPLPPYDPHAEKAPAYTPHEEPPGHPPQEEPPGYTPHEDQDTEHLPVPPPAHTSGTPRPNGSQHQPDTRQAARPTHTNDTARNEAPKHEQAKNEGPKNSASKHDTAKNDTPKSTAAKKSDTAPPRPHQIPTESTNETPRAPEESDGTSENSAHAEADDTKGDDTHDTGQHEAPVPVRPPDDDAPRPTRAALHSARQYGDQSHLVPPSEKDTRRLHEVFPREGDGFARFADPRGQRTLAVVPATKLPGSPFLTHERGAADWVVLLNGDPSVNSVGRQRNCMDATRAFLSSWYGEPVVAAAIDPRVNGPESGSMRRTADWLGAEWRDHRDTGDAGETASLVWETVAADLLAQGHGASAVVVFEHGSGVLHAVNAVNHEGTVLWIDPQHGRVTKTPLSTGRGFASIVLDPKGKPLTPAAPGTSPLPAGAKAAGPRPSTPPPVPYRTVQGNGGSRALKDTKVWKEKQDLHAYEPGSTNDTDTDNATPHNATGNNASTSGATSTNSTPPPAPAPAVPTAKKVEWPKPGSGGTARAQRFRFYTAGDSLVTHPHLGNYRVGRRFDGGTALTDAVREALGEHSPAAPSPAASTPAALMRGAEFSLTLVHEDGRSSAWNVPGAPHVVLLDVGGGSYHVLRDIRSEDTPYVVRDPAVLPQEAAGDHPGSPLPERIHPQLGPRVDLEGLPESLALLVDHLTPPPSEPRALHAELYERIAEHPGSLLNQAKNGTGDEFDSGIVVTYKAEDGTQVLLHVTGENAGPYTRVDPPTTEKHDATNRWARDEITRKQHVTSRQIALKSNSVASPASAFGGGGVTYKASTATTSASHDKFQKTEAVRAMSGAARYVSHMRYTATAYTVAHDRTAAKTHEFSRARKDGEVLPPVVVARDNGFVYTVPEDLTAEVPADKYGLPETLELEDGALPEISSVDAFRPPPGALKWMLETAAAASGKKSLDPDVVRDLADFASPKNLTGRFSEVMENGVESGENLKRKIGVFRYRLVPHGEATLHRPAKAEIRQSKVGTQSLDRSTAHNSSLTFSAEGGGYSPGVVQVRGGASAKVTVSRGSSKTHTVEDQVAHGVSDKGVQGLYHQPMRLVLEYVPAETLRTPYDPAAKPLTWSPDQDGEALLRLPLQTARRLGGRDAGDFLAQEDVLATGRADEVTNERAAQPLGQAEPEERPLGYQERTPPPKLAATTRDESGVHATPSFDSKNHVWFDRTRVVEFDERGKEIVPEHDAPREGAGHEVKMLRDLIMKAVLSQEDTKHIVSPSVAAHRKARAGAGNALHRVGHPRSKASPYVPRATAHQARRALRARNRILSGTDTRSLEQHLRRLLTDDRDELRPDGARKGTTRRTHTFPVTYTTALSTKTLYITLDLDLRGLIRYEGSRDTLQPRSNLGGGSGVSVSRSTGVAAEVGVNANLGPKFGKWRLLFGANGTFSVSSSRRSDLGGRAGQEHAVVSAVRAHEYSWASDITVSVSHRKSANLHYVEQVLQKLSKVPRTTTPKPVGALRTRLHALHPESAMPEHTTVNPIPEEERKRKREDRREHSEAPLLFDVRHVVTDNDHGIRVVEEVKAALKKSDWLPTSVVKALDDPHSEESKAVEALAPHGQFTHQLDAMAKDGVLLDLVFEGVHATEYVQVRVKAKLLGLDATEVYPRNLTTELTTSAAQSSAATFSASKGASLNLVTSGFGSAHNGQDPAGTLSPAKPSTGTASLGKPLKNITVTSSAIAGLSNAIATKEYFGGEKVAVHGPVKYTIELRRVGLTLRPDQTKTPVSFTMEKGFEAVIGKQDARLLEVVDNDMPAPEPATRPRPYVNGSGGGSAGTPFFGHVHGTLKTARSTADLAGELARKLGMAKDKGKAKADGGNADGNKGPGSSGNAKVRALGKSLERVLSPVSVRGNYRQLTHGGQLVEDSGLDGVLTVELVPKERTYGRRSVFDLEEERNLTTTTTTTTSSTHAHGTDLKVTGGSNTMSGAHDGTLPPGGAVYGSGNLSARNTEKSGEAVTRSETTLPTVSSVGLHADVPVTHELRITYQPPGGKKPVVVTTDARGLFEVHPWQFLDAGDDTPGAAGTPPGPAPAKPRTLTRQESEDLTAALLDRSTVILDMDGARKIRDSAVLATDTVLKGATSRKTSQAGATSLAPTGDTEVTGTSKLTKPGNEATKRLYRQYDYRATLDSLPEALRGTPLGGGYRPPGLQDKNVVLRDTVDLRSWARPKGIEILRPVHHFKPEDHSRTTRSQSGVTGSDTHVATGTGLGGEDALQEPVARSQDGTPPPEVQKQDHNGLGESPFSPLDTQHGGEDASSGDRVTDRNAKPDDELRYLVRVPVTWYTTGELHDPSLASRLWSPFREKPDGAGIEADTYVYALVPARLLKEKGLLDEFLEDEPLHPEEAAEGTHDDTATGSGPGGTETKRAAYDAAVADAELVRDLEKRLKELIEDHQRAEWALESTWADLHSLPEEKEKRGWTDEEFLSRYTRQLDRLADHALQRSRVHQEIRSLDEEWGKASRHARWSSRRIFAGVRESEPERSTWKTSDEGPWLPPSRWVDDPTAPPAHRFTVDEVTARLRTGHTYVRGDRVWDPSHRGELRAFRTRVLSDALGWAERRVEAQLGRAHDEATRNLLESERKYFAHARRVLGENTGALDPVLLPETDPGAVPGGAPARTAAEFVAHLRNEPVFTRRTEEDGPVRYEDSEGGTYTVVPSSAVGERLPDLLAKALGTEGVDAAAVRDRLARELEEWADEVERRGTATREDRDARAELLALLQPETGRSHAFTGTERAELEKYLDRRGPDDHVTAFAARHLADLRSVANVLHPNAPLSLSQRAALLALQIRRGPDTTIEHDEHAAYDHPGNDLLPRLFARAHGTEVRVVRDDGARTYTEFFAPEKGGARPPVTLLLRDGEVSLLERAVKENGGGGTEGDTKGKKAAPGAGFLANSAPSKGSSPPPPSFAALARTWRALHHEAGGSTDLTKARTARARFRALFEDMLNEHPGSPAVPSVPGTGNLDHLTELAERLRDGDEASTGLDDNAREEAYNAAYDVLKAHDRARPVLSQRGVSFLSASARGVIDPNHPGPGQIPRPGDGVIHRDVPEYVMINGEAHVPVYSALFASEHEKEIPAHKDFVEDENGNVIVHTGSGKDAAAKSPEDVALWVSFGSPLRQLAWVEKYTSQSSASEPVIRSFLLPLKVVNEISSAAYSEYQSKKLKKELGHDTDLNVDKRYGANQFGIVEPESLEKMRHHALPGSLRTYTDQEQSEYPSAWGEVRRTDELRERLGVPSWENRLRGGSVFIDTSSAKAHFNTPDKSGVIAESLVRHIDVWKTHRSGTPLVPETERFIRDHAPEKYLRGFDDWKEAEPPPPGLHNRIDAFMRETVIPGRRWRVSPGRSERGTRSSTRRRSPSSTASKHPPCPSPKASGAP